MADHDGEDCDGPSSIEESCNAQECPGDETWISISCHQPRVEYIYSMIQFL